MKTLKNLRNDLVRLRNLSSEKKGNIRNSPLLEKTHCFLYSDTECILKLDNQSLSINKMMQCCSLVIGVLNQPFVYIFSCQIRKDGLSSNLSPRILVLTKQQPQKTAALLLNENLQERKRSSTKLNPPTSSQKHRRTKPASLRVRQRLLTYFERLLQ